MQRRSMQPDFHHGLLGDSRPCLPAEAMVRLEHVESGGRRQRPERQHAADPEDERDHIQAT